MKFFLKTALIINILIFSLNAENCAKDERNQIKCLKGKIEKDKIGCDIECYQKRIEKEINKHYTEVIQLSILSEETSAEDKVKYYNNWKKNKKDLKNSKADYFSKEFYGYKELKDGRTYYVVFIFHQDKNVSAKELYKRIIENDKKKEFTKLLFRKYKISINMKNKIIKDIQPHEKFIILEQKADCYAKNKENSNELMKCLKKEAITAIQIHALPNKEFCEKAKENCDKGRKCQCIEKNVKGEPYYTIVETIEASEKDSINKIKEKESKPFKLNKPEVLIK